MQRLIGYGVDLIHKLLLIYHLMEALKDLQREPGLFIEIEVN